MGKLRPRKKVTVVVSSDEEEEDGKAAQVSKRQPVKRTARSNKNGRSLNSTPQKHRATGSNTASPSSQRSQASPSKHQKGISNERPIYSFFNAQAQRQKLAPPTNGHTVNDEVLIEDDEDAIEDIECSDDALPPTTGQNVALPSRRKRKINEVDSAASQNSAVSRGSQLFKRVASEQRVQPSKPVIQDLRPWTERFAPVSLQELAVHKKKVQDVRNWLQRVTSGIERKRLLILKGSAGTGKTITTQLVAQDLGIRISEWQTSGITNSEEGFVSMSAQFEDFVARSGTFGALDLDSGTKLQAPAPSNEPDQVGKQIVLIEEFPNTFSKASNGLQAFRNAVLHYLESTTPSARSMFNANVAAQSKPVVPIVMIISESLLSTSTAVSDSFTAYRLLGPDILGHHGTTLIEFNSVAATFMIKALDLVLQKESKKTGRRRAPGPSVLKHIAEIGDIRSAISSLEFLCLRNEESSDWSGRVTFGKQKKADDVPMSAMETESLQIITQRESSLGIFHAVGKVVYNKRETPAATNTPPPQPPTHLPHLARPKISEVNIESLLNELGTDISTFVAALHENYILSCQGLDSEETLDTTNGCIDSLSDADILSPDHFSTNRHRQTYAGTGTDSLRQDEISFQTSVRGLLFNLPHPVKRINPTQTNAQGRPAGSGARSTAYQMFYPASLRVWRGQEETEEALDTVITKLRKSALAKSVTNNAKPTISAVEAWRLNRFGGQRPTAPAPQSEITQETGPSSDDVHQAMLISSTTGKEQMLLERLPYMSLMRRHSKLRHLQDISKHLDKITRMGGMMRAEGDPEEDLEGTNEGGEQWSTDRPSEDANARGNKFPSWRKKAKADVVDTQMQSLVLSDDDIED